MPSQLAASSSSSKLRSHHPTPSPALQQATQDLLDAIGQSRIPDEDEGDDESDIFVEEFARSLRSSMKTSQHAASPTGTTSSELDTAARLRQHLDRAMLLSASNSPSSILSPSKQPHGRPRVLTDGSRHPPAVLEEEGALDYEDVDEDGELMESPSKFVALDVGFAFGGVGGWMGHTTIKGATEPMQMDVHPMIQIDNSLPSSPSTSPTAVVLQPFSASTSSKRGDDSSSLEVQRGLSPDELEILEAAKARSKIIRSPPPHMSPLKLNRSSPSPSSAVLPNQTASSDASSPISIGGSTIRSVSPTRPFDPLQRLYEQQRSPSRSPSRSPTIREAARGSPTPVPSVVESANSSMFVLAGSPLKSHQYGEREEDSDKALEEEMMKFQRSTSITRSPVIDTRNGNSTESPDGSDRKVISGGDDLNGGHDPSDNVISPRLVPREAPAVRKITSVPNLNGSDAPRSVSKKASVPDMMSAKLQASNSFAKPTQRKASAGDGHVIIRGSTPQQTAVSSPVRDMLTGLSANSARFQQPPPQGVTNRLNFNPSFTISAELKTAVATITTPAAPPTITPPTTVSPMRSATSPKPTERPLPASGRSSPDVTVKELSLRLADALEDADRHRRALGLVQGEAAAKERDLERLRAELRRVTEEVGRKVRAEVDVVRTEAEERIHTVEREWKVYADGIKRQLEDAFEKNRMLELEVTEMRERMQDQEQREQAAVDDSRRVYAALEQARMELQELHDSYAHEKSKHARYEDEFRMFGKRLRGFQDSTISTDTANFYKDKLEQASYDISSLKALSTTLSSQNDILRSALDAHGIPMPQLPQFDSVDASSPNSPTGSRRVSAPPSLHRASPSPLPFSTHEPAHHQLFPARRPAWGHSSTSTGSTHPLVTDADRRSFTERMRRLEDDTATSTSSRSKRPTSPSSPSPSANLFSLSAGSYPTQTFGRTTARATGWPNNPPSPTRLHARPSTSLTPPSTGTAAGGLAGALHQQPPVPRGNANSKNTSEGVMELLGGDAGANMSDYLKVREELDARLRDLNAEKGRLNSELQRIPTASGGVGRRRRREELEERLDEVEKGIGAVKMKMRGMQML
ncbi:hypothetical protein HK101_010324 [Irineochytrium annulatum]|nr:hypothetical protein HK101_010324 [Irineochytrium annulatum]